MKKVKNIIHLNFLKIKNLIEKFVKFLEIDKSYLKKYFEILLRSK